MVHRIIQVIQVHPSAVFSSPSVKIQSLFLCSRNQNEQIRCDSVDRLCYFSEFRDYITFPTTDIFPKNKSIFILFRLRNAKTIHSIVIRHRQQMLIQVFAAALVVHLIVSIFLIVLLMLMKRQRQEMKFSIVMIVTTVI